ncbi:ISNCY family transposase [Lignipirellula cremea]|uniref:Integrase core domain protein n=1 Tax=Lignipirellula cremea TaxID=2528010 RepID=A0A518DKY1_9BACT|nr:ISNCY family transposase [Lignipirellula cremea]QDU92491.1 Integrase core domain protein [Lignipirellula cremea]
METILMNPRDRKRLEVFSQVSSGTMSLRQASEVLGVSYRQAKRIWSRYQQQGDAGLLHQARGRASNRQPTAETKERALTLYREQYADYGPTLAAECLTEEDRLPVAVSTLRRWLVQAGLWQRSRKQKVHRRRRDRRQHQGELVQLDGSHHDWFEGRRPHEADVAYTGWAVLMVMIDDATGRVFARFYENESWRSAADVFQQYTVCYGLPRGLYVDQHGIYRNDREPTSEEILADFTPETQFGRAMREIDVKLILARSPQAKGRVERMNGTLQDRLVKALRRHGVSDLAAANTFLEEQFLPAFNRRFSVAAGDPADWHQALPGDMARILSIQEPRVVQNDWTVSWSNRILQLARDASEIVCPRQAVTICEQLDGVLRIFAGDVELSWSPGRANRPRPQRRSGKKATGPIGSSQGQKPSPDHPWR